MQANAASGADASLRRRVIAEREESAMIHTTGNHPRPINQEGNHFERREPQGFFNLEWVRRWACTSLAFSARPCDTMRRLALFLALAFALFWLASANLTAQNIATTTVQGTVYLANGRTGTGTLLLNWPAFTTANGQSIAADRITVPIPSNGAVSVNLAPNQGATPAGLYYTAVFDMSDGTTSTQYWIVPNTTQASLAQVQAQVMPAAQAAQAVSKTYVDQAIAELQGSLLTASGGNLSGPLYLNADPTQPLQAADKHYVDQDFAAAVPLAGGNMTGALQTPAVNGVESPVIGSAQATLQTAMNAAGNTGAMQIPPGYAGADTFTNPNGVFVKDWRTANAQQQERSVKEFGAVCDGVSDDTNALQAALNYANAHSVALTVPQGICKTRTLNWHGESIGGLGKQVSALMGFPGQDVLASVTDSMSLLHYTHLHDLTIYVDQSVDASCSAARGRAAAGNCMLGRPIESNSIFSPGGNGLTGALGSGAGWSVGNCAIAMPAATGLGGNGLRVADIENLEIAATGTDPLAAQYPGAHSTHTCGFYLAQWPQWSEFRHIDMRGLNTGIVVPALPVNTPSGLNADSNRWQDITIQATHAFTAAAGSNNVLDNVVAIASSSAATGETPTGLVLDLSGPQQGWTVRNAVVMPTWTTVPPQLIVAASGGAITGVTLGAEHGLGFDPYGAQVPLTFSGSCTAQANATIGATGSVSSVSVTSGGVGCSSTTTASLHVAGTWDTAAPVNLVGGANMMFFAGNLLKGNGGYTVWNAANSQANGTQWAGGGNLPGGGTYPALVANAAFAANLESNGSAQFNGAVSATTAVLNQPPVTIAAGGADIGAQINAALANSSICPTDANGYQHCVLNLPYAQSAIWASTVTVTSPYVSIVGQGSSQSTFSCTVNGDCLRILTSPFTINNAGTFKGFTLIGTGATNGVGLHLGEIVGAKFTDVFLSNFTGAGGSLYGFYVRNAGAGCTGTPAIVLSGAGSGAAATTSLSNGSITQPVLTASGSGYGFASGATTATISGLTCTTSPVLVPVVTAGAGMWWDNYNPNTWTERDEFDDVRIDGSSILWRTTTEAGNNSFGYNDVAKLGLRTLPGNTFGISLEDQSLLYNGKYFITSNNDFNSGVGSLYHLSDYAQWLTSELYLSGENNGGFQYIWDICATCAVTYHGPGSQFGFNTSATYTTNPNGNPPIPLDTPATATKTITASGDVVVAVGYYLYGTFALHYNGSTAQDMLIYAGGQQYQLSSTVATLASITPGTAILTNPRIVLDANYRPQLVVTVNATSGTLSAVAYSDTPPYSVGSSNSTAAFLFPNVAEGTTSTSVAAAAPVNGSNYSFNGSMFANSKTSAGAVMSNGQIVIASMPGASSTTQQLSGIFKVFIKGGSGQQSDWTYEVSCSQYDQWRSSINVLSAYEYQPTLPVQTAPACLLDANSLPQFVVNLQNVTASGYWVTVTWYGNGNQTLSVLSGATPGTQTVAAQYGMQWDQSGHMALDGASLGAYTMNLGNGSMNVGSLNIGSVNGVPVFTGGAPTYTAQVGLSGGSPVKATNTYGCLDGYDHTPCVVADQAYTSQSAGIGTYTLTTPSANGWYRASCYTVITTPATTSSTLPSCDAYFTDSDSGVSPSYEQLTNGSTSNAAGVVSQGRYELHAKAATAIKWATVNYASQRRNTHGLRGARGARVSRPVVSKRLPRWNLFDEYSGRICPYRRVDTPVHLPRPCRTDSLRRHTRLAPREPGRTNHRDGSHRGASPCPRPRRQHRTTVRQPSAAMV